MLKIKERLQGMKLQSELNRSEKKLKSLNRHLIKVDKKLDVLAIKDYREKRNKYFSIRHTYIKFLKDNNLWTKDMEEKFNSKKLKHPLRMAKFDENYIRRLARQKLNKELNNPSKKFLIYGLKVTKRKYGDAQYENYLYHCYIMGYVEECCRVNNWLIRQDWKDKNVPMNKLFKEFFEVSVVYSEIKRYYSKQFYDQRTALYKK